MRIKPFGRTGLLVSEICLGTMTFGGRGGIWSNIGEIDQSIADRMLARADAGQAPSPPSSALTMSPRGVTTS